MIIDDRFYIDETDRKGPYVDVNTKVLVLQEMDWGYSHDKAPRRTDEDGIFINRTVPIFKEEKTTNPRETIEKLEKKGKVFRHTREYYAALEDEQERMRAYRTLTITGIQEEEEQEIQKNPLKFLGLQEGATWGQVRSAYIILSKIYHPDVQNLFERQQRDLVFGSPHKISFGDGKSLDELLEETEKLVPPVVYSEEALEKLSKEELTDYERRHDEYRKKEYKFERIKAEMVSRATKKMQLITRAFQAARKLYSQVEIESLAGFQWEDEFREYDLGLGFNFRRDFKSLYLEGPGKIIKDKDDSLSFGPRIAFDFGDCYLEGLDYRQHIPLKPFFAWTQIAQGKELSPLLLDNIVKYYKLGYSRAEQLRLMLMNREDPYFILKTLKIPNKQEPSWYSMLWFTDIVLNGPTYFHLIGSRVDTHYPLGVELLPNGAINLKYHSQYEQCFSGASKEDSSYFTPSDVKIMLTLAYGPMLQEMNRVLEENNIKTYIRNYIK